MSAERVSPTISFTDHQVVRQIILYVSSLIYPEVSHILRSADHQCQMACTNSSNARLRTKTGCVSCTYLPISLWTKNAEFAQLKGRNQRKKCDEQKPRCRKCVNVGRSCSWPGAEALQDRRRNRSPSHDTASPSSNVVEELPNPDYQSVLCSNPTILTTLRSEREVLCFRYFADKFYPLLILPKAHPGFANCLFYLKSMALHNVSLKDSLVACSTMHMHSVSGEPLLRELALTHYGKAVSNLHQSLSHSTVMDEDMGDPLLASIAFLYIFGVSAGPRRTWRVSCG